MEEESDESSQKALAKLRQASKKRSFFDRIFKKSADELFVEEYFGEDKKPIQKNAEAMLLNLRNLHTLRLDDIAIPKTSIEALSEESTMNEVVEAFRTSTFTRIPVYSETLDNPLGLIHLKDFALRHGFNGGTPFDIKSELRPLIYAPPSMSLGSLLQKMQAERIHMALVIDEYGGVEGLVTIEDLLEQIVGDIIDEHDVDEDRLWTEEKKGVFLVYATLELQDFSDQAGVDLRNDNDEYDTIGGLVFSLTNRIPIRGELIKDSDGNEFSIIDADPRRIKRLRIYLAPKVNITASDQ